MNADVLVIGAGVAGLACAGELAGAGRSVVVLEQSRGVGGRCATRRIRDHRVDFGVGFYHGHDLDFLAALDRVSGPRIDGWPRRVRGRGRPCQPRALLPDERRVAFRGGVNEFPKTLAHGLDVRRRTRVRSITPRRDAVGVLTEDGATFTGLDVVVALPAMQAAALLGPAATFHELRTAVTLLADTPTVPCLTLMAGYGTQAPEPDWDAWYPDASDVIQLVLHDSAKRETRLPTVLVIQAQPSWSLRVWEHDDAEWRLLMLEEARRVIGDWIAEPEWTETHRWRHARSDRSTEFARPILLDAGPGRIGLAGELLSPGSGVQAAWLSGRALARRLLAEA